MVDENLDETIRPTVVSTPKQPDIARMKLEELKNELKKLNLKTSGNKRELHARLLAASKKNDERNTTTRNATTSKENETKSPEIDNENAGDDHVDEVESEVSEEEETDEEESSEIYVRTKNDDARGARHLPTFKDVGDTLNTFSGDNKKCVRRWIQDFEDVAELCQWSDIQKTIYARSLLRGSARVYVNYERCTKTWSKLKRSLISEFEERVNSHDVHKRLCTRRKKNDESFHEYIYAMLGIAAQAHLDKATIIDYIIDGVQDEEVYKAVLYGAKTIRELKEKFGLYEKMRVNAKIKALRKYYAMTDISSRKWGNTKVRAVHPYQLIT
ncbi:hypothetical protein KPH14_012916 [Odynerus spinipes]|uniref:SAP domain-containing protein n=1 Tax=Odynerus spinipes TaxID=1348599 RepID=A0AAD9RDU3_9HYME|nr:hypothetical protein KPH14_012916 [Odynerus spinipes]